MVHSTLDHYTSLATSDQSYSYYWALEASNCLRNGLRCYGQAFVYLQCPFARSILQEPCGAGNLFATPIQVQEVICQRSVESSPFPTDRRRREMYLKGLLDREGPDLLAFLPGSGHHVSAAWTLTIATRVRDSHYYLCSFMKNRKLFLASPPTFYWVFIIHTMFHLN